MVTNTIAAVLSAPLVAWNGAPLATSARDVAFNRVVAADRAADAAWASLKTADEVKARQEELRSRALEAIGALPERTPLNVQVTGTWSKPGCGYRIEKILFESRPNHHVTGHLFLPDHAKFKPPYPGLLVPCGHSSAGKAARHYQRGGVDGALAGFATFVVDPLDQGERSQLGSSLPAGHGHQHAGARAHLLGEGFAQYRIWDAIRAVDVMCARGDIDSARLGVMGMSGGGTLSAYAYAFDSRLKTACPAGFISTVRDTCDECGPQDAEQNIRGQLAFGLNHLGLLLLRYPDAVCPVFSHDDFFPFRGSMATYGLLREFYGARGLADNVAYVENPGPHTWYESSRVHSLDWMRERLDGEKGAFSREPFARIAQNVGCSYDEADVGLAREAPEAGWVAPKGRVASIPGERTVYDLLRDKFRAAAAGRGVPRG